jgi:hypothetical protein
MQDLQNQVLGAFCDVLLIPMPTVEEANKAAKKGEMRLVFRRVSQVPLTQNLLPGV